MPRPPVESRPTCISTPPRRCRYGASSAGLPGDGCCRRRFRYSIHRADLVCHRVARYVKPLPAAVTMEPPFVRGALHVTPEVQIVAPLRVAHLLWRARSCDVAFAPAVKLDFVARSAMRAIDYQHCLCPFSARCRPRRPRRRGRRWQSAHNRMAQRPDAARRWPDDGRGKSLQPESP